jgi:hypothetical protein
LMCIRLDFLSFLLQVSLNMHDGCSTCVAPDLVFFTLITTESYVCQFMPGGLCVSIVTSFRICQVPMLAGCSYFLLLEPAVDASRIDTYIKVKVFSELPAMPPHR